jgi:hypothetical protein
MTTAQADEWKAWGVDYLRKNLKLNKTLAEKEMQWVNLQWGLKYSDWNENLEIRNGFRIFRGN